MIISLLRRKLYQHGHFLQGGLCTSRPTSTSTRSSSFKRRIPIPIPTPTPVPVLQVQHRQKQQFSSSTDKIGPITTASSPSSIPEPSSYELRLHALTCGIPFIGFGIMDNAILIWAGDQIDTHLGVLFGISTLCAAAIGNIISDIAGVGLGAYIEDFCATKLRLPKVNFSSAQRSLRSVRFAGQIGNMIGLTLGCIIGMFPLLFIDTEQVQQKKKEARMDKIFYDVVSEVKGLVGAESTCLYLIVDESSENHLMPFQPMRDDTQLFYLCSKYEVGNVTAPKGVCMKEPISRGIVGRSAVTGQVVTVTE